MIPSGVKVFLASHPIYFRKGADGLLSLVRDRTVERITASALYVFRAKRAHRIKIVWWDGSGVCLYAKRLEKSKFFWPRIGHNRVQLNHAQLLALVDGLDWKWVRAVPVKPPEIGADLIRRAGNHLLGRQHVRLDKVAYSVVRHAQSRRRLCHGKPFALFIG